MKVKSRIFYWYVAFVVAHIALTLIPSPDKVALTKYHLTPMAARLLDLTLLVPILVIWFAAFYGYKKLHKYGQLIKRNKDGKQIVRLSRGLLVLAVGLPVTSILSDILTLIARHHTGFTAGATIITNYATALYFLSAFLLLSAGARGLSEITRTRPSALTLNAVALIVIALGVVLCDLIARSHHNIRTTYHMSYSLVMLTLAIPYMYTWFLGLFAMAEIYQYSKNVAGVIYRKGWDQFVIGLGAIILIDIGLQYLGTLSTWLNALSLSGLLALLYVLLLLLAGAFIVVALGTKKLIRIEEA